MTMNLFTKRPLWLQRALGLTDASLPQYLSDDMVVPVIDVAQSGWASARPFSIRADLSTAGGIMIGSASWAKVPGGLELAPDEMAIVLGFSYYNSTAAVVQGWPFVTNAAPVPIVTERNHLGAYGVPAAGYWHQASQSAATLGPTSWLPLVIPAGYALGESQGAGGPGLYATIRGIRLPDGVKPF